MGLFSSKKKVYVSSVVYNLAGDEADRPDYLKSFMAQHMATPTAQRKGFAEALRSTYLHGPALEQRAFFRWCFKNYPAFVPQGEIHTRSSLGFLQLSSAVPAPPAGARIAIDEHFTGVGDFVYWAEEHVLETYPDRIDTAWTSDDTPDGTQVIIQYVDGSTETIPLSDYDTSADYLYVRYREVTDTRDALGNVTSSSSVRKFWRYRIGSGTHPEFDGLLGYDPYDREFFPALPLRLDNTSIRHLPYYADVAAIYRKMTNRSKLDTLLDNIETSDSIGDIDHCFLVHGVPLNAPKNAQKRYIYELLNSLKSRQTMSVGDYQAWRASYGGDGKLLAGSNWARMRGGAEPPATTIRINGQGGPIAAYDIRLHWLNIEERFGTGQGKVGASAGDLWFGPVSTVTYLHGLSPRSVEEVTLFWQRSASSYSSLTIRGLVHENYVYGGKAVRITASEALADADESGFLMPIHYQTLQRMPVTDMTQVATENRYLVFNCYQVVKRKWWQSGIFRVLLMIATIVVAVVINPGAMAAMPGVLGTNLAVGTAIGLSGLAAVVAGAAVNAIAATILVSIIQAGATEIFGDKLGALIGAIASVVAVSASTAYFTTGSLGMSWANLMRPENLLRLTEAGAEAYAQWAAEEIGGLQAQTARLEKDYQAQSEHIQDLAESTLGYSGVVYDPLQFTRLLDSPSTHMAAPISESSDTFLRRTLMTGSDIVALSHQMIEGFVDISLELPSPIS